MAPRSPKVTSMYFRSTASSSIPSRCLANSSCSQFPSRRSAARIAKACVPSAEPRPQFRARLRSARNPIDPRPAALKGLKLPSENRINAGSEYSNGTAKTTCRGPSLTSSPTLCLDARSRVRTARQCKLVSEPSGGAPRVPHRVCMSCGQYRGEQILAKKTAEEYRWRRHESRRRCDGNRPRPRA